MKYTPDVPKYGNLRAFFQPSSSITHNISVEQGTAKNSVRLSGSFLDENSPVPNNNYKKYNLRVVTNHKIGKTLEISPSFSIIKSGNDKPLRGVSGYLMSLMAWPEDDNAKNYITADGLKKPLFASNPNGELDNPYFNVNKNRSRDELTRSIATLAINYNPTKWLSISGRMGYDTYAQDGYTKWDSSSYFLSRAQKSKDRSSKLFPITFQNFYKRLLLLRTHGVKNILRVEKWGQLGFNFKYTDIQASIAINEFGEITKRKFLLQ
jgi:hypothetical protein